jgi:hypothetical protein
MASQKNPKTPRKISRGPRYQKLPRKRRSESDYISMIRKFADERVSFADLRDAGFRRARQILESARNAFTRTRSRHRNRA